MAKLVVLSAGMNGRIHELNVDKTTIGSVEDNTFQIADPSVSSHHCEVLLRGTDVDKLGELFESGVTRLQAAGCRVMIFTGFDPRAFPVIRLLRGRIAAYNMHLRGIADAHGCDLVDLWSMRALQDVRAWSPDRLHLASEGHRRVALRTCEVLAMRPEEVCLVAAHNQDLAAARRCGLKTGFVPRANENAPNTPPPEPTEAWDLIAGDFNAFAEALGF